MERRHFLIGFGSLWTVALTGCIGNVTGSGSRTLTLTTVDDAPEPLSFEVSVSETELSSEKTPTLEISAENTGGDSVSWSYAGQTSDLPFPQAVHDLSTSGLVIGLQDEVQAQLMDVSTGCSRVDSFVSADGIQTTTLAPNDRIEETYAIAGVNQELSDNCPETGTYRMEYEMSDFGTWGFEYKLE